MSYRSILPFSSTAQSSPQQASAVKAGRAEEPMNSALCGVEVVVSLSSCPLLAVHP